VIVAVDGKPTPKFTDLQAAVKASAGAPVKLTVWRDGKTFEATMAARERVAPTEDGGMETRLLIGISGSYVFDPATRPLSLTEAVTDGARMTVGIVTTTFSALGHMISGAISTCNLNGPIGIAKASGAAASQGWSDFIWLIAALSTAVGMINLFPIPILDGGHLVFHAWEWARGKPPSERALRFLMTAGLAIVLALMVFGLSNDLFCA
jgi:regulator of sigma E protease